MLCALVLGVGLVAACRSEVVIGEFAAENDGHLLDVDGESTDWLELYNNGAAAVRLGGWFLSDDAQEPFRWPLPDLALEPGARRVIFASGKDRRDPAAELHANFALSNNAGGYLALRKPDGSYATVFAGYPEQHADISFGEGTLVDGQDLVVATTAGKWLVPTTAALATTWTAPGFNDAGWMAATSRLGYQVNSPGTGLPIVYWTFDDTPANTVASGPEATLSGPTYSAAVPGAIGVGKSLHFTRASNTYVIAALDVSETAFSSSLWFRATQATTGLFCVGAGTLSAGGHDRHVFLSGGNIGARTWNNESIASTGKNYADNQWHHVAHVIGPSINGQRLYVDGVEVAAGSRAQSDFTWQEHVYLGFSLDATNATYHDGEIDDVSIWSETLSAAAITSLASGTPPNLLAGFAPYISCDTQAAMRNVNATAYLRLPFTVDRPTPFNQATLKVRYDDGFVAYLDGVVVARRNAPAAPTWNSSATANRATGDAGKFETIDISAYAGLLSNGNHVLAIHALNDAAGSSEFLLNAELSAATLAPGRAIYLDPPTPGSANTTGFLSFVAEPGFSPKRGLFTTPQTVTLTCATPGATIAYTTDGTDPSPASGTQVAAANSTTPPAVMLPVKATTYLRAMAYKNASSLRPTRVASHTYIFTPQVLTQSNTQPGYPAAWTGHVADYGMDPGVVNSTLPGYSVTEGLLALPSISITAPAAAFFGSTTPLGIYHDTTQRGDTAEREVSIEWINPDGSPGWQAQAGARPHGNSSRMQSFTPKHPLRLCFRADYGTSRLRENVFGSGVSSFDELLLRACSTDSMPVIDGDICDGEQRWNNDKATYMRDQYLRDVLNELGHPNCRGVYAHFYVNGLYWGICNLSERPVAAFFASTFGGAQEEWDVLKDAQEVNDGNASAWNELVAIVNDTTISDAVRCQKLLGNNPDGSRNPAYPIYLHWPSFRDYMIVHIAAGSEDWPDHNYWVGRRRGALSDGFHFVAWDQEISNDSLTRLSGRGSNAPFESVGDPVVDGSYTFGPAMIYDKMRRAEPFKTLFRERVHELLFNNGALTPAAQKARWAVLQAKLDKAIVAESARWGDANGEGAKKRETTWLANMTYMNASGSGYWDAIHPIDVQRFRNVGLYPRIYQPAFSQNGGTVAAGFRLALTSTEPTVYFTRDGSDPMGPSGAPAPGALLYTGSFITETPIPAKATWKYLVTPTAPASSWRSLTFVDTSWSSGPGQLGYGDSDEATPIGYGGNNSNRYMTTYFRKNFTVTNKSLVQFAKAYILRDDGAVIHLNGVEVGRSNMPASGAMDYTTAALSNPSGVDENTYYEIPLPVANLLEGNNVLAVEIHKVSAGDGDLSFDGRVEVFKATGGASAVTLNASGWVKSRARTAAGEWSGLNSAYFTVGATPPSAANIVFSEVHYHPAPPTRPAELAVTSSPDEFEFIELMNVGETTVDFTGAHLADGVLFDFPVGYSLAPGGRGVVVRNVAAFEARYGSGRAVAGTFGYNGTNQSGLNNGGETLALTLTANGITTTLFNMTYKDGAPWPGAADGGGSSLVLIAPAPNVNHSLASSWIASADQGGTPGQSAAQMTFPQWRHAYQDTLDPNADDDGDGIANVLEYALGLKPLVPESNALPVGRFIDEDGQSYLAITFRHRPAADLTTMVEASTSLGAWRGGPAVVLVSSTDAGDGTRTQTWRCATPTQAAGATRQFLHIRCVLAP